MPLKTHHDEQPTLNLTPMIDIVFLLIIFFMVGAKFTELERNIRLQVPAVSKAAALTTPPTSKIIHVKSDGQIVLDHRQVTLDQLRQELQEAAAEYPKLNVLVRGAASGRFQNVADVLNACRQAGVSELGISVRMAQREGRRGH